MRFFLLSLVCLMAVSCASSRKEPVRSVSIVEIKPRYIETEQFKRISEYMTGKENQGDRVILRSQPLERTGYYFALILDENVRRLPRGSKLVAEFYTPKSLDAQVHEFTLPPKLPKSKEVFVGLTGEDWTYGDTRVPSAWKFTFQDANGEVLGEAKSYLWSF
ncbi:hypothetical protein [Coraliomargarita parva]|uniref:hypothetical protein n=1 Tax=Coraliomargarita parva TaxID=3014050 RepID=UPI0022B2BDA4|nr:hypothetical protein [Coraliomargarita parva]